MADSWLPLGAEQNTCMCVCWHAWLIKLLRNCSNKTKGELKSSGASSRKTPTSTVKTGKSDVGLVCSQPILVPKRCPSIAISHLGGSTTSPSPSPSLWTSSRPPFHRYLSLGLHSPWTKAKALNKALIISTTARRKTTPNSQRRRTSPSFFLSIVAGNIAKPWQPFF